MWHPGFIAISPSKNETAFIEFKFGGRTLKLIINSSHVVTYRVRKVRISVTTQRQM